MARLPDLQEDQVAGVRPSTDVVEPTDLGLGQVSQTMESLALASKRTQALQIRAQAKQDQQAAQPYLLKLQDQNETAYASDAAAYTGDQPGFAADQIAKAQKRRDEILADPALSPGVRSELSQLANGEVARIGRQAIGHEAQIRAQPILDQQRAQEDVQVGQGLTSFITQFAPAQQKLLDTYDGSQHGLTDNVAAAFDTAAQGALAATPERLRGKLQARLAAMRVDEVSKAAVTEQRGADAYLLTQSTDQANSLINTVVSNPLAYDSVVNTGLPSAIAGLPAHLKKDALTEFTGMAAVARVRGLVDQGETAQAKAELEDGRYDAVLKPQVKEELTDHVLAAEREHGPKSFDEWAAAIDLEHKADAETYARLTTGKSTGQVDLAAIAQQLSPERAAEYASKWGEADRQFAAAGAVRDRPAADLAAVAASAPPDPSDPDYASKITTWQTQRAAAAAELKARQDDPAGWAMTARPPSKGARAAASAQAQDRGAMLQGLWQDVQAAQGPDRAHAAGRFAGTMLGVQAAAGVPASAREVLPKALAGQLAASVINAAPEQKLQAMQGLAGLISSFPVAFKMPDGSTANPQSMLARQLQAAHLDPVQLSAIVDYGADPAKLGRVVAALNDPTLKKPLEGHQEMALKTAVQGAVAPFLASVAPLPGAQPLAQARIDRTVMVARGLIAHQGLSPQAAAQAAAQDMSGGYRYIDTWRMPEAQASASSFDLNGYHSGAGDARAGAARLMAGLTMDHGANLYAPAGLPGGAAIYAAQVQHAGRWVTAPDDSGLMLMVPHPDGSWDQVADKWGRPVRASWTQLQAAALGRAPGMFAAPATAVRGPDGKPLPAVSRPAAFAALSWAVTGQESGFRSGLVSSAGALGRMQVTPDTVKTYAPRLGLPVDLQRARSDDAYNQKIGEAALSDHLQHFGTGAGVGLALAAYNAGRGRLEGFRDPKTNAWHPGWLQTIGDPRSGKISLNDWVSRVPVKETRDYLRAVLPAALGRLQGAH